MSGVAWAEKERERMIKKSKHKTLPLKVEEGLSPVDNDYLPPALAEQDVVVSIKNIQQQLVFLEKKIDILIGQSQARPFSEKHFSKPFRPFGRPHFRSDREHDNTFGEKSFDRGRHFEKRHGGEKRGGDNMVFQDGYDRRPREMHKAVCSDCKKECEVPFKPSGDRPIYCSKCFSKRKDSGR